MGSTRTTLIALAIAALTSPASGLNGCPPASKDADKCEGGVSKAFATFVAAVTKCHTKQADGAFKQKPVDDEACESDAPKSAQGKLDAALAKLASVCPAAVASNVAALESGLLSGPTSLDGGNGLVYCDQTSGVMIDPSGEDAGFVPAGKDASKCSDGVAKNLAQLWAAIEKCSVKTAHAGFKGKSVDEGACREAAIAKYGTAEGKLKNCPACLDSASQDSLRDALLTRLDAVDAAIFVCPVSGTTTTTTTIVTTTTSTVVTPTTTTTSTTSTTLATSANCPAGGTIDVVSLLVPTPTTFTASKILGLQVDMQYPSTVSMPGTQFLPVNDPADPTTLIALLSADFSGVGINLYNGSPTFFDADGSAPLTLKTLLSLAPEANLIFNEVVPFERARFTCTPGTGLAASSFPCAVSGEVDVVSRSIPPDQRPVCSVGFAP